jgi:hypothetical protein
MAERQRTDDPADTRGAYHACLARCRAARSTGCFTRLIADRTAPDGRARLVLRGGMTEC